jgi:parvulin-like peptidyl-prolyl isomerase
MLSAALLFALFQADKPAPPPTEPPPTEPAPTQSAPAEAAPAQAPPQDEPKGATPRPPRPDSLNGIQFVVNEEAVTKREFINDLRRDNKPNSTAQELERALQQTFYNRVQTLLMEQGGRDLGYDENIVKRYVDDSIKDNIQDYGGIVDLGVELKRQNIDPTELREMKRRAAYRELWGLAVDGRQPGASGRPSVDRYVRPGRLLFEYERLPQAEVSPVKVSYQSIFIAVEFAGSATEARAKADDVVDQARGGADFTALVREHSHASSKVRDGWDRALVLKALTDVYPELGEFLASATPQAVSDPIAVRVDGELVAFQVVSSVSREQPDVDFMTTKAQEDLRKRLLDGQSRYRREREISRMLDAAFVWPPEHFRPPAKR